MTHLTDMQQRLTELYPERIQHSIIANNELTIEVAPENLRVMCLELRQHSEFNFDMLIDVCGVDYLHYGLSQWETESATATGFERGVEVSAFSHYDASRPRFATVYHLLSLEKNHRIRIRCFLPNDNPVIDSVVDIWPAANWFEREAYDLFGIVFQGHADLRRILTDYGFLGHPFRKDFPLNGKVEVRYDAETQQVIYEPVSIPLRILEPKVIRRDNRYEVGE